MDRFLPLPEVEQATSLKKSKIYELIRACCFPRQREITRRRRAWLASEIEAWIAERAFKTSNSQKAVTGGQS